MRKPSFLFFYLMTHLVDVKKEALVGEYLYEVKAAILIMGKYGKSKGYNNNKPLR